MRSEGVNRGKALRLWPGVAAAVLLALIRFGVPIVAPDAATYAVLGGCLFGVMIVVWWAFFSRAPGPDRLGGVALIVVALAATPLILHESLATGMMGMMFYLYSIPVVGLVFVVWAVACRHMAAGPRRAAMAATVVLACAGWALWRTEGVTGDGAAQFAWRWTETSEERLLARGDTDPLAPPPVRAVVETPEEQPADDEGVEEAAVEPTLVEAEAAAEWPGFRGAGRDSVISGVRIETDWTRSPPVELWRRAVGPGWSSFAVRGGLVYTQEQRGEDEVVSCYNVNTGEPVWMHREAARFWESNAGPGPRATPTLSGDRVYTFGATGILNALDYATGAAAWSRNAASDTGMAVPMWGFSSSPVVVDGVVIIALAGQLAAYDAATGEPHWLGPAHEGEGYSSPHLMTIDGVEQVLLMSAMGATSVAPGDGTVLWEHEWSGGPIVQSALTDDGDVLITTNSMTGGIGIRRLAVAQGPEGWKAEERWTSTGLKPYFNDFVVHEGHAFGFDGHILSSIDLRDGARKWKGGRYGNGQLVLLADQDLLLVVSEDGELALVEAKPDQFTEVARFRAIEGKTWNHPALAGDVLLVRNGEEMAAFRLTLESPRGEAGAL